MTGRPPREASLPPGYDEADPYEDVDLSTFPDWWRRNVEEFREHGMRPYRPPLLSDGTILPGLLAVLEAEYDAEVRLKTTDPGAKQWELVVDGRTVKAVEHERDGGGYTQYGIDAEELEAAVKQAVSE